MATARHAPAPPMRPSSGMSGMPTQGMSGMPSMSGSGAGMAGASAPQGTSMPDKMKAAMGGVDVRAHHMAAARNYHLQPRLSPSTTPSPTLPRSHTMLILLVAWVGSAWWAENVQINKWRGSNRNKKPHFTKNKFHYFLCHPTFTLGYPSCTNNL